MTKPIGPSQPERKEPSRTEKAQLPKELKASVDKVSKVESTFQFHEEGTAKPLAGRVKFPSDVKEKNY